MRLTKINGFIAILIISFISLAANASAEISFFDNPFDAFILGYSATGGAPGGITEIITGYATGGALGTIEATTSGVCIYKWNCTNWGECLSFGKQIRACTNIGTCLSTYKSPEITRNCISAILPLKVENEEKAPKNETEICEKEKEDNKAFIYFAIFLIVSFIIFLIIGFVMAYLKVSLYS